MKDYYSVLGVSPNVSQEVLDAIYKNLVKNQTNNTREIEEAYKILSNSTLRKEYDESFKNNSDDYQRDTTNNIIESEYNETVNNSKKHKPKIFPILILIVIVILGIKLLSSESPSANTIWGTFETEDGEFLSVEMIEDFDDDLYTAYISRTEIPWVKEYVIIDLNTKEIMYPITEEIISFEFKNRKLIFDSNKKEYKKISDNCNYKEILNKELMTASDIVGVYQNIDGIATIIISESKTNKTVNIGIYDNLGQNLGSTVDIPYENFYNNGEVNISIEGKSFPMYFARPNTILCYAFKFYSGGFIKLTDVNISNTDNSILDEGTYENNDISLETPTESEDKNENPDENSIKESEPDEHDTMQENEVFDDTSNEKYKWYLNNSLFTNHDQSVGIEIYEEDDEQFIMFLGDFYGDYMVEHNQKLGIDIIPDEIGANGEFIYQGDNVRIVYHPNENYISVEMDVTKYDGIYKPFLK